MALWVRFLAFFLIYILTAGVLNFTIKSIFGTSAHPEALTAAVYVVALLLAGFVAYKLKPKGVSSPLAALSPTNLGSASGGAKNLAGRGFVVVDVETTGLNSERNKIIEIAAIKVLDTTTNSHTYFSSLVKIKTKVPEKIVEITGITDEMLKKDGEDIDGVMKFFAEFVGDLPVVAYNAEFDKSFIQITAEKTGVTLQNEFHCALKMMREAWPGLPSYKLANVSKSLSFADEANHRALGDCKKTLIVYVACLEKLGKPIRV